MKRRSFVTVLALGSVVLAAPAARADIAWEPPPRLEVHPEPDTFGAPPRALTLRVTNPGQSALELSAPHLVVLAAGVRVPVRITRMLLDGQAHGVWDPFRVAARASVRVRLEIEEVPAITGTRDRIDFGLRFQGSEESHFTLRHA